MTTTEMAGRLDARLALHGIHAPRASRVLAQLLVVMIGVAFLLLIVTPWQQNIAGSGRVIAFNPEERPQDIDAPLDGRIVAWHVVEGQKVRKGDPIVDMSDNDPSILERMTQEREQTDRKSTRLNSSHT